MFTLQCLAEYVRIEKGYYLQYLDKPAVGDGDEPKILAHRTSVSD